jgi:hypothetical protein
VVPIWKPFIQKKVAAGAFLWKKSHGAEIKSFLKYVDSNWIGELNLKTKARKIPAYSSSVWNKQLRNVVTNFSNVPIKVFMENIVTFFD